LAPPPPRAALAPAGSRDRAQGSAARVRRRAARALARPAAGPPVRGRLEGQLRAPEHGLVRTPRRLRHVEKAAELPRRRGAARGRAPAPARPLGAARRALCARRLARAVRERDAGRVGRAAARSEPAPRAFRSRARLRSRGGRARAATRGCGGMTDRPRVSLLLPNYNNGPILQTCLDRLVEHTTYPDIELIVADDGSTDNGVEILKRFGESQPFPRFTLLEREHGDGFVTRLNEMLEYATGDVIVKIDGDATVETPSWD